MRPNVLLDKCNWSLLRIFRVIVQEGSLNKAAIKLFLTQSAISQSLKRLEEQIGETLIIRTGGKFYLTVLSRIESTRYDQLLHDFHQKYPLVDFQVDVLKSKEIQQLLLQKIPALGIGINQSQHPKLNYQTLINQKYALFCSDKHSLYTEDVQSIEQIKGHGFISFQSEQLNDPSSPLNEVREIILKNNRLLVTTNNMDEVIRFIQNGIGIGLLPKNIIEKSSKYHLFKQLPPFPHVSIIPISLAWHKDRELSLLEQYFINDLRSVFNVNHSKNNE